MTLSPSYHYCVLAPAGLSCCKKKSHYFAGIRPKRLPVLGRMVMCRLVPPLCEESLLQCPQPFLLPRSRTSCFAIMCAGLVCQRAGAAMAQMSNLSEYWKTSVL